MLNKLGPVLVKKVFGLVVKDIVINVGPEIFAWRLAGFLCTIKI